ncbi:hypothetical protein [Gordonia rubripertincta]|uniref:Uncharacterized protein n=1 Tax=Gordonia rubripertincta TaxID=36822 RepID=A0ABT4N574_GORRU|nr:hypothetical protein [Gordonia rubripertincta]MCZ4553451.1 hypothetical protein [Gordonia rubripertincta]
MSTPNFTPNPAAAPLDPTIRDLVESSPLGPILDTPVSKVLADLGLPALPELSAVAPLPGLPPLPPLDLSVLIKPITDLLGGFGTGNLGGGDVDPTMILEGLSQILEMSMGMGSGALKALDQVWTGQAAAATTAKGAQAGADTAALSTQGGVMSIDTQGAAAIVGTGLSLVQGIIAKTIGIIAASAPILVTPPGQALALGVAAEGLAEATAVVTATRAQLLAPTSHMVLNGQPVPVTGAPAAGPSPFSIASTVLDGVGKPMVTGVGQLGTMTSSAGGQLLKSHEAQLKTAYDAKNGERAATVPAGLAGPGGAGRGGGGGGSGPGGGGPSPLSARTAPGLMSGPSPEGAGGPSNRTQSAVVPAGMGGPMAPMGAMGAGRGAGASDDQHETADYLVTELNGSRIIGEISDVAPAVIGETQTPDPAPSPDVRLRLGPPARDQEV